MHFMQETVITIIMFDANDEKSLEKTEKFGSDILKLCVKHGGVLSENME